MMLFKRTLKWGNILVAINDTIAISGVWFEGQKYYPTIGEADCWIEAKENNDKMTPKVSALIALFDCQMKAYEEGRASDFKLPLAAAGSEFRQLVWQELLAIPLGETRTYGEIGRSVAAKQGKVTMSGQAIGGAVGHNPISILIPCHRVIGANGTLTGYAGGIDKKFALLEHEGVQVRLK